jgi:O-antigen ligase
MPFEENYQRTCPVEPIKPDEKARQTAYGEDWASDGKLKSTLIFISLPAIFIAVNMMVGGLPKWFFYSFFVGYALTLVVVSLDDVEKLLAVFILYVPLSLMFPLLFVPKLNGTNLMLLALLFMWFYHNRKAQATGFVRLLNVNLVSLWLLASFVSLLTNIVIEGGTGYFMEILLEFKEWLDQFIIFFAFINLIRDGPMARRVIVYLMVGTMGVAFFGMEEAIDRDGRSSMDDSRVSGPQGQPNDFGAFIVYNAALFIGVLSVYLPHVYVWPLLPYVFIWVKLLLVSYSRGAYLGFAAMLSIAGYARGKLFVTVVGVVGLGFLLIFPQFIPGSITSRLNDTQKHSAGTTETKVDASSQTRLILWKAASQIILEHPVFGVGFKRFQRVKAEYTEADVHESDTHNMYFWIATQLGLPALGVFALIFIQTYFVGVRLARRHPEPFARAMGVAAAGMMAGIAVVNIFGSRMTSVAVYCYVWIFLAAFAHLHAELLRIEADKDG